MNKLPFKLLLMAVFGFYSILLLIIVFMERDLRMDNRIKVLSATFGENCKGRPGNLTKLAQKQCTAKSQCTFVIDVPDPAPACKENFIIEWTCGEKKFFYPVFFIKGDDFVPGAQLILSCPTVVYKPLL